MFKDFDFVKFEWTPFFEIKEKTEKEKMTTIIEDDSLTKKQKNDILMQEKIGKYSLKDIFNFFFNLKKKG